jgi:hypothetical protein
MKFLPEIYGGYNFGQRVGHEGTQICQNFMDHFNGFIVTCLSVTQQTSGRAFIDAHPK